MNGKQYHAQQFIRQIWRFNTIT